MNYLTFVHLLTLSIIISESAANTKCSNEGPRRVPKYYLIEKCHRSKLGIAAKAKYSSLTSCKRLGIEKKGLAINFSPPEATNMDDIEPLEYTCEVLKCAESEGGLSLTNDTRFDYYSIYAKPVPDVNSTCVPATGIFYVISSKMNFSQALRECKNLSGVLADVTSEKRTDALATLLAGSSTAAAMVGMKRTNSSKFVGVNGEALDCTTYRAWAPGHPRKYADKFDCVVLTRHRSWLSTSCKKRYPVLCELAPGGPYKIGSIFASKKKNDTETDENNMENDSNSNIN